MNASEILSKNWFSPFSSSSKIKNSGRIRTIAWSKFFTKVSNNDVHKLLISILRLRLLYQNGADLSRLLLKSVSYNSVESPKSKMCDFKLIHQTFGFLDLRQN